MRVGDDRHVDADHPRDLRRVHAAGVDDDVGADGALVGHHLVHAAVLQRDAGDARALLDVGPAQPGAVGQREGQLAGVEVAVLRQEGRAQHAVGAHRWEHLLRLCRPRRSRSAARSSWPSRPGAAAPPCAGFDDARRSPPSSCQPGSLPVSSRQVGVKADGVLHHLGQADRRAELADQPGRVPCGAVGEPVLLDQHDVRPAQLGEVVEDAAAPHAAADHHRPRFVLTELPSRITGIDQSKAATIRVCAAAAARVSRCRRSRCSACPRPAAARQPRSRVFEDEHVGGVQPAADVRGQQLERAHVALRVGLAVLDVLHADQHAGRGRAGRRRRAPPRSRRARRPMRSRPARGRRSRARRLPPPGARSGASAAASRYNSVRRATRRSCSPGSPLRPNRSSTRSQISSSEKPANSLEVERRGDVDPGLAEDALEQLGQQTLVVGDGAVEVEDDCLGGHAARHCISP